MNNLKTKEITTLSCYTARRHRFTFCVLSFLRGCMWYQNDVCRLDQTQRFVPRVKAVFYLDPFSARRGACPLVILYRSPLDRRLCRACGTTALCHGGFTAEQSTLPAGNELQPTDRDLHFCIASDMILINDNPLTAAVHLIRPQPARVSSHTSSSLPRRHPSGKM